MSYFSHIFQARFSTPWKWDKEGVNFDMTPFGQKTSSFHGEYKNKPVLLKNKLAALTPVSDSGHPDVSPAPGIYAGSSLAFSPSSGEYNCLVDTSFTITLPPPFEKIYGGAVMIDLVVVLDANSKGGEHSIRDNSVVFSVDASRLCDHLMTQSTLFNVFDGVARASTKFCGLLKGLELKVGVRYSTYWLSGQDQTLVSGYWASVAVTVLGMLAIGYPPVNVEEEEDDFEDLGNLAIV